MVLRLYRLSHWLWSLKVPILPRIISTAIRIVFSAVVPPSATIGRGVVLGYGGLGIVIHARAVVGNRVLISPNVTIGGRSGKHDVPVIGDDVLIGAGAKILGPVKVGAGARIGANAVVLHDVPDGATAVGVPATLVVPSGDKQ
ncbi:DapH/DapD/GlmU-related protein [Agrilutibacter niabensis]|uniref:serine O-acetyltransferase n=1 Tax=Agrilutibacter niabensis TaxID=380628 RepID=UPI00286A06A7|nr:DapH/DapD/GlmU-related protein [Lysobacter niabensis]